MALWRFHALGLAAVALAAIIALCAARYEPNWDSIDSRPLPAWYDEAKIGIFVHWGVYSVPAYGCDKTFPGGASAEWYWWYLDGIEDGCYQKFHNNTYGPNFKYQDFGNSFRAELWDPNQWADLFADAGIKYVVFTTKHHEGWTNWQSPQSWNWNAVDNGPHRDLVADLAQAVRKAGMRFGASRGYKMRWFH